VSILQRRWSTSRITALVIAVGLSLRAPVVQVSGMSGQIEQGLGLSASQMGAMTSIPVLCFALFAPVALFLMARLGPSLTLVASTTVLTAGVLVRSVGDVVGLTAGTILTGASIAVVNIVVPVWIYRDVPPSARSMVTGAYMASLCGGSALAVSGTAVFVDQIGWRTTLAAWAPLAAVALVASLVASRGASEPSSELAPESLARQARRWKTAVLLGLGFGAQSFTFYGIAAWLPSLVSDMTGTPITQAGIGAALFQLLGIAGALVVPLFIRLGGVIITAMFTAVLWLGFVVGLMLAPELWVVWAAVGGVAQAAAGTFVFTLIVLHARDDAGARSLSFIAQGIGYTFATIGPMLMGALHDAFSGWRSALVLAVVTLTMFGVAVTWSAATLHVQRRQAARELPDLPPSPV
jgi:CP family cyanate transporter-like MFS transporter